MMLTISRHISFLCKSIQPMICTRGCIATIFSNLDLYSIIYFTFVINYICMLHLLLSWLHLIL